MGGHDVYSMSKGAAELVIASYRRSFFPPADLAGHGVALASARAGNVIGGGDWAAGRIVPDIVRALSAGLPVEVRNPAAIRPWQHVLEPLSGYLLLATRLLAGDAAFDGAWNFGPEPDGAVRVREVVDAMVAAWGSGSWTAPDAAGPQPHEAHLLSLDISKAREELGWRPLWDVRQAVGATAGWYAARHGGADSGELTRADIAAYSAAGAAASAVWTR